jgi:hypothetical protein
MDFDEFTQLLPHLADSTQVALTMSAGDLRRALVMATGGPEIMSTTQAANQFGWTSKRWRGWAKDDLVDGAFEDEWGNFRLPKDACRRHVDRVRKAGKRRRRGKGGTEIVASVVGPVDQDITNATSRSTRRTRRGPRKKIES